MKTKKSMTSLHKSYNDDEQKQKQQQCHEGKVQWPACLVSGYYGCCLECGDGGDSRSLAGVGSTSTPDDHEYDDEDDDVDCCSWFGDGFFWIQMAYTLGPIGVASVLIWDGWWGLMDFYLFPHDVLLSSVSSLILAVVLAMICHGMNHHHEIMILQQNTTTHTKKGINHKDPCHQHCYNGQEHPSSQTNPQHGDDFLQSHHSFHEITTPNTFLQWIYVTLTGALGACYWRGIWKLWEAFVLHGNRPMQHVLALSIGMSVLWVTNHYRPNIVGPSVLVFIPMFKNHRNATTTSRRKKVRHGTKTQTKASKTNPEEASPFPSMHGASTPKVANRAKINNPVNDNDTQGTVELVSVSETNKHAIDSDVMT